MSRDPSHRHYESYRCDDCAGKTNRCAECRARRAAKQRELRALKAEQGVCLQCRRKATRGQLCKTHQAENLSNSKASHALARAEGRE